MVKVQVGRAGVNASALRDLRDAWSRGELVIFLGAGASIPYGVPSWRDLVLELLFDQAERTRRLGSMWPHYRRALASWMTDYFDYDPLVLARIVERALAKAPPRRGHPTFLERLRAHLYGQWHEPPGRTLLDAVADLAARRKPGVGTIVTFNFDDLLERALDARGVRFASVAGPQRRRDDDRLRVVHVHGFVPQQGETARETMVFTEPDYHALTESIFHWGLAEIVDALRKRTVLFLGLSMSDPSLRRLLDASRNWEFPPHYQVQKRHEVRDHEMSEATAEVERRARRYAEQIGTGFDEAKRPEQLEEAVGAALLQADSYDRQVFESMGVKTIWVGGFDEIPAIVDAIPVRTRPASRSRSASRQGPGARRGR
jgi:hypothetical protein